jgi:hypothetical protein
MPISRVPLPAEYAEWNSHQTLEETFQIGNGRPIITSDLDHVLPYLLTLTDQTGHTQPIALIARAPQCPDAAMRGLPFAYFATTD